MNIWKRFAAGLAAVLVCTTATISTATAASTTTGWRLGAANVCVQDQTVKLTDGVKSAAVAWTKAADLNLYWRRSCTGFATGQRVVVKEYTSATDHYYGRCGAVSVYTAGGYLKPGIVTRATVSLNMACRTVELRDQAYLANHYLGKALGLTERTPGSPSSVMSSAWLPTATDYALIEKVYPW